MCITGNTTVRILINVLLNAVADYNFSGKCGNDGFYYNDESSIIICSNGNVHIQPCAPGSKNSAPEHYHKDNTYNYRDFCDINLVNGGYTLQHGYAAKSDYAPPKPAYNPPMETAPVVLSETKTYQGNYEGR
jgi:hypothetical protein